MYIVMIRSTKVRGMARKYGPYKHVAIVEVEDNAPEPRMISERARGVVRIVRDSGAMWAGGKTPRSTWVSTLAEYRAECAHLNEAA